MQMVTVGRTFLCRWPLKIVSKRGKKWRESFNSFSTPFPCGGRVASNNGWRD